MNSHSTSCNTLDVLGYYFETSPTKDLVKESEVCLSFDVKII